MGGSDVLQHRRDALRRLRAAVEFGACTRGDLLGAAVRRPLVEAFVDPANLSAAFGLRGAEVRGRWGCLVRAAADGPSALGFVQADGAMRDLADRIGVDADAFLRNLRTWSARRPPIVVTTETSGPGSPVLVQVPLLTAWLLWTAEARAVVFRGVHGFIGVDRVRQVAVTLIAHGELPPREKTLLPLDADRLIRLATNR